MMLWPQKHTMITTYKIDSLNLNVLHLKCFIFCKMHVLARGLKFATCLLNYINGLIFW